MNKENILKTILDSAKEYHANLENNNILFISGFPNNPHFFEASFLPRNFLHLTGVKFNNETVHSSINFYNKCLDGRLGINEFFLSKDGQTEKKLKVLPQLMNIHKTAKMVGDFNMSGIFLSTDKLAGGTFGCLGFVQTGKYYYPNTALNRDIRQIVSTPNRVLAILRKPINQKNYTELCYTAKGIHLDKIKLPNDISNQINIPEFHQNDEQASGGNAPAASQEQLSGDGSPATSQNDQTRSSNQQPTVQVFKSQSHEAPPQKFFEDIAANAKQRADQHNANTSQRMNKSQKLDLDNR